MLKNKKRMVAIVLACTMVGSSLTGFQAKEEKTEAVVTKTTKKLVGKETSVQAKSGTQDKQKEKKEQERLLEKVTSQTGTKKADTEIDKEETVYVTTDASGKVDKVIVSDWVKNKKKSKELKDTTDLEKIKNVKGKETYIKGKENQIIWKTEGNDIYYQGETKKELPVTVKVSYQLDGKKIDAKDILGKSGKVKIRIDYENKEKQEIAIQKEKVDIYTPFTAVSGMILPVDKFSNVEVTNGKVISDANNNIVMGFSFPGLQESLGITDDNRKELKEDISIPDFVEVTAEVKDFELGMTMTVITTDMLSSLGFDDIDSIEDLEKVQSSMNELSGASTSLKNGTGELKTGIDTLNSKTGEFKSGVDTLASGIEEYTSGVGALGEGAQKLKSGANELNNGVDTLVNGINSAKAGADQLVGNYGAALEGARQLAEGTALINQMADTAFDASDEQKAQIRQIAEQLAGAAGAEGNEDLINVFAEALGQVAQQTAAGIQAQLKPSAAALAQGAGQLQTGMNQLAEGTSKLQSGLNELSAGGFTLKNGVGNLCGGTSELANGADKLVAASPQMKEGVAKLSEGTNQLSEGTGKLANGAKELQDGMIKFDKEGIAKLTDAFDGDVQTVVNRMKAISDAAKNYHVFSQSNKGDNTSIKFIVKTGAIEKE